MIVGVERHLQGRFGGHDKVAVLIQNKRKKKVDETKAFFSLIRTEGVHCERKPNVKLRPENSFSEMDSRQCFDGIN